MKKSILLGVAAMCLYSCQDQTETTPQAGSASVPYNRAALDQEIWTQVRKTGSFDWNQARTEVVWSALQQSDHVLSVGYKPMHIGSDLSATIHTIDIEQAAWKEARQQVLELIYAEEGLGNTALKRTDLVVFEEKTLPVLNVRVSRQSTLEKLRASEWVRYAEPMGYEPKATTVASRVASSSGCGGYTPDFSLVANADYTTILPNAKASWNHPYHRISQAWNQSNGDNVKVLIMDTGISPDQVSLGSGFVQAPYSQNRTIEKLVTLPRNTFLGIPIGSVETPADGCGHGTCMAGVLAAPRGNNGNAAGIAYACDLVTVRVATDVLLDESREVKGVSDAYVLAGNRADVKIISMSLGRITSSSQMADAIRYAYNKGKLMFCAAGTSFGWSAGWFGVIFPASMSEVQAVTGVREDFSRCQNCHQGAETDFMVVMEKTSTGLHPITTVPTGEQPGTVGGSSVATAQTAGMAALVWSRFPTLSREQLLQRLVMSTNYYPNRNGNFGWGAINAEKAVSDVLVP